MSWRWLYFFLAIFSGIGLLAMIVFLPETRWNRSHEELRMQSFSPAFLSLINQPLLDEVELGHNHNSEYRLLTICTGGEPNPNDDNPDNETVVGKVSARNKYGLFANGGINWKAGVVSLWAILRTLAIPLIIYLVLLNAVFIGICLGSSLTMSSVLLAPPYNWPLSSLGLVVIGVFISNIFVIAIGGVLSDKIVSWFTIRNGGQREAEMNLVNLILPIFFGILGCILFGVGGQYVYNVHWMTIQVANVMILFAFVTVNVIASVVALESFPALAG